ncbi:RNA-binding domain-containing protein [Aureobasidium sp. EXF-12298]|nr:RNA-binding domain-containing protein [Aureobasidium sp. EXF-12298]
MLSQLPTVHCQHPSSRGKSSGEGDFFFYVEGLPPYYTWGMLKDLTRKAAPYPGWTEMASNPQDMQKGRGWIKIKRAKDAFNLYEVLGFLTTGSPCLKPLKVYLWSTARSPPELLRCNDIQRPMQPFSPPQVGTTFSVPMNTSMSGTPMSTPMSTPIHMSPVLHPSPPVGLENMSPAYVYTSNHRPINATGGLVQTESKGIFIHQLDYAVDQRQLEEYLRRIGSFDSCEIRRDPTSGRSRGIATAKFANAEAAARAVQVLHGQRIMSKTISVRFDTEKEAVTPKSSVKSYQGGLIIANGSH